MENDKEHPRVLIEEWFPFKEIGIECQRERGMVSAMPGIYFLHVWWARRPLIASRAAILSSILPADFDKSKFQQIMGYSDEIIKENKRIKAANIKGIKLSVGYTSERCFKKKYDYDELNAYYSEFWQKEQLNFLDPMSGGGSIPFESQKLGLNVYSSDLNPVATVLLNATLKYPLIFGKDLIVKVENFANRIIEEIKSLSTYFPFNENELEFDAFIWVRTVICPNPECTLTIPLFPNYNISKKEKITLHLIVPTDYSVKKCNYQLLKDPKKSELKKASPTVKGGKGICPRCGSSLTNDYIKSEAQKSRMNHELVCIVSKIPTGPKKLKRIFRLPNKNDFDAINDINIMIEEKIKNWIKIGLLPNEKFPKGSDNRPIQYGAELWYKLFNNRQLLSNMSIFESIINLKRELLSDPLNDKEEIKALITYLQLALDKVIDYNSIQVAWHSGRSVVAHTFTRHDFAVRWTYAEMDVIRKGFKWAIKNVLKAYKELVELIGKSPLKPNIFLSSANNLSFLEESSIDIIVTDPPYYDNVMYAELSDYFYVWMKRGIGDIYPELFSSILTDKDNEAVANSSKFEDLGKSKKLLAKQDYEAKMNQSFKEMYRVLQEHGVLTIMFTHKSTDAWDTLSMSLMEAGFEITASWPIYTESNYSLNIAKKNSVKSTIFLVCRKRIHKNEELWWEDDVLPAIKKEIIDKARKFRKIGIEGVDLFISCFGPALKEFSKSFPVKNIAGDLVRAEEALEVARKVVIDITLQDIIKGKSYNIDQVSKFYLTAWHFFKARIFPFDEARRLALSIGINIDELKTNYKILNKKSGDVSLILPKDREKNGTINIENPKDNGILINAVHIAILAYEEGGQKLYDNVVEKLRRNTDKSFRLYMETLFNILPDVKDLAQNLPEKKILGEILMTTEEKITPKGGKITDFLDK